jgi:hypothetical protein
MKKFKDLAEQYREEGRFKPVITHNVKSTGVGPRPQVDSAKTKLKEEVELIDEASKRKLMIGSKVTHPDHGQGTVVMHAQGGGTSGTIVKFAAGKKVKVDHKKLRMAEEVEQLEEGRPSQRHPLEGHEYHKKTNAELEYIAKDAHKAAEAMKGHNTTAENKYRDQANDSATVRYFRKKSGTPDWYKKKYGHMKEESDTTEKTEMAQTQLHFMKYAAEEILEFIEMGGEVEEWYQNKLSKVMSDIESLHSYVEGESRRTGMKEEVEVDEAVTYGAVTPTMKAKSKQIFNAGVKHGKAGADKDKKHMSSLLFKKTYLNGYKQGMKEEVDPAHKRILDKAKTSTPKSPKGEYDRKVVKYLKKKHDMKEEVVAEGSLNELSSKTLQSYEKKAIKSMNKNLSQMVKTGDLDAYKRGDRRATGIAKAGNKLDAIELAKKGVAEGYEDHHLFPAYMQKILKKHEASPEEKAKNAAKAAANKAKPATPQKQEPYKPLGGRDEKSGRSYSEEVEKTEKVNHLQESRRANIVREAMEAAKKKKKQQQEQSSDKFNADPTLSSEIVKT